MSMKKPVVVVSKCLGFASCRYDGKMVKCELVRRLKGKVIFKPVCPEMGIGLGSPRPKINIVKRKGSLRLMQQSSGLDLTGEMNRFSADFMKRAGKIDAFVLKSRSPSCDIEKGFFAKAARKKFPDATFINI